MPFGAMPSRYNPPRHRLFCRQTRPVFPRLLALPSRQIIFATCGRYGTRSAGSGRGAVPSSSFCFTSPSNHSPERDPDVGPSSQLQVCRNCHVSRGCCDGLRCACRLAPPLPFLLWVVGRFVRWFLGRELGWELGWLLRWVVGRFVRWLRCGWIVGRIVRLVGVVRLLRRGGGRVARWPVRPPRPEEGDAFLLPPWQLGRVDRGQLGWRQFGRLVRR